MNLSVELSLYPLKEAYVPLILSFIERLQSYAELKVVCNSMSTQVFGPYDEVMRIIAVEMKTVFDQPDTIVMVMKAVNSQLVE